MVLGPPPGLEGMAAETTMKRVKKRRGRRGTAAQLQVPGPDQRMMGAVWWTEAVWTGPGEGWRGVRRRWVEGRWRGVAMCLQLELVGRRPAAVQEEGKLDLPLPHPAGLAEGRVQRDTGEGGVRVKSRWVVRRRWTVMGMEVQEQAQVLMENLKNRVGRGNEKVNFYPKPGGSQQASFQPPSTFKTPELGLAG